LHTEKVMESLNIFSATRPGFTLPAILQPHPDHQTIPGKFYKCELKFYTYVELTFFAYVCLTKYILNLH